MLFSANQPPFCPPVNIAAQLQRPSPTIPEQQRKMAMGSYPHCSIYPSASLHCFKENPPTLPVAHSSKTLTTNGMRSV
jgi:hypothetical protein